MFILDNVKLATRNFKTRKLRTFLTILGISVGIGTTLFLVSLGYGLQKVLLEKIATSDTLLTLDVGTENPQVKINHQTVEELSAVPNVTEVSPLQTLLSQFHMGDITSNVPLNAIDSSFFRLGGVEFLYGEGFKEEKELKVVLSTGALNSLGYENKSDSIGKEAKITLIIPAENESSGEKELLSENEIIELAEKFIISGVVEDDSNSFGYIPSGWSENIGFDNYDSVKVKISDRNLLETVRATITEKGLTVLALTDTIDQANKIFSIVQIVLSLFGIVALVVSAIGSFNTMTIALLERTNEIGIMKSIGASNKEIYMLFLTESIAIGFLGGLGGVIIGLGGAYLINIGFNVLASNLGGETVSIFYTPLWFIGFIIVFSTFIGLITGIYPARRASKLNPLMALRYK